MILNQEDIQFLLKQLEYEDLYADGPIRLQKRSHGWSEDPQRGRIQAALSVMLEVEHRRLHVPDEERNRDRGIEV